MPRCETDVQSAFLERLLQEVGEKRFQLWFEGATRVDWSDGVLRIGVLNQFVCDWLRTNLRGEVSAAADAVVGASRELRFEVITRDQLSGAADGSPEAAAVDPVPAAKPRRQKRLVGAAPAPDRPAGGGRPLATFDEFVEGDENRIAAVTCRLAAEHPGRVSPILLHGPTSVGKTHLLEAVWRELKRRSPSSRVVLCTAEQFMTDFVDALHHGGMPNFRSRFRQLDALLIDDAQFLGGKRATINELRQTTEDILRRGGLALFAADRPANELVGLGPELQSRLAGGAAAPIAAPEYETRRTLAEQMSLQADLSLDASALELLASRLTMHARQIQGAVWRIKVTSLAEQVKPTRQRIEQWLADLISASERSFSISEVEEAVCEALQVERSVLLSKNRSRTATTARMLAMWAAREYSSAALSEIGQHFGGRTHSTVASARKRVEAWRQSRRPLSQQRNDLDVDEAIRRIERQLQAG